MSAVTFDRWYANTLQSHSDLNSNVIVELNIKSSLVSFSCRYVVVDLEMKKMSHFPKQEVFVVISSQSAHGGYVPDKNASPQQVRVTYLPPPTPPTTFIPPLPAYSSSPNGYITQLPQPSPSSSTFHHATMSRQGNRRHRSPIRCVFPAHISNSSSSSSSSSNNNNRFIPSRQPSPRSRCCFRCGSSRCSTANPPRPVRWFIRRWIISWRGLPRLQRRRLHRLQSQFHVRLRRRWDHRGCQLTAFMFSRCRARAAARLPVPRRFQHSLIALCCKGHFDWLVSWSAAFRLIDWSIDCSMVWLIACSIARLIDWLLVGLF